MDDWLSFQTNHMSWFKENGVACSTIQVKSATNATQKMSVTSGCALEFEVCKGFLAASSFIVKFPGCFSKLVGSYGTIPFVNVWS